MCMKYTSFAFGCVCKGVGVRGRWTTPNCLLPLFQVCHCALCNKMKDFSVNPSQTFYPNFGKGKTFQWDTVGPQILTTSLVISENLLPQSFRCRYHFE